MHEIHFKINTDLCTKCGLCEKVCAVGALELKDKGFPEFVKESCMECQHCLAVCPEEALSIYGKNPQESETFSPETIPTPQTMETLIKGRRSTRIFKHEDIPKKNIDDILNTISHAPTGKNNREIGFKVIYGIEVMNKFRNDFYSAIETAQKEGSLCEQNSYLSIFANIYREKGRDILFRGAPHLLLAMGDEKSSIVHTDSVIALSNFELLAAVKGYGTLWNGFITNAIETVPALQKLINLKEDETFCYAMCFGIPAVKYKRTVQRGPAVIESLS